MKRNQEHNTQKFESKDKYYTNKFFSYFLQILLSSQSLFNLFRVFETNIVTITTKKRRNKHIEKMLVYKSIWTVTHTDSLHRKQSAITNKNLLKDPCVVCIYKQIQDLKVKKIESMYHFMNDPVVHHQKMGQKLSNAPSKS